MSTTELVQLVDDCNRPIAEAPRQFMRRHKLLHRATYVLVVNDQGELCVQHRSESKDYCPGMLDLAAGGVVTVGESYRLSAERELHEELGIRAPLEELAEFYSSGDDGGRAYGRVYVCQWNDKVVPQAEEIDEIEWLRPGEILRTRTIHATPDSLLALRIWLQQPVLPRCEAGAVFSNAQQRWKLLELAESRLLDDPLWLVSSPDGKRQLLTAAWLQSFVPDGDKAVPRFVVQAPTDSL